MSSLVLQVDDLAKRYGATVALEDVSFSLNAGEVCGLLGENGAGKSTLVKALSGVVAPDHGEICLKGDRFRPTSIVDANRLGVSTAFQELSLVPSLSVATNLALPDVPKNAIGLVSGRELRRRAEATLAQWGAADIRPSDIVDSLPLGVRQRVEIIRALARNPSVLLLDEPTSALSDREWLFGLIDRVLKEGVSILYITHKLDEIRRLCRRCIILRNGQKVLDQAVSEMSNDDIFRSMAGRSAVEQFIARASSIGGPAGRACVGGKPSDRRGHGGYQLCFAARRILGVAGLEGHGQGPLFRALVGLHPLHGGRIAVAGTARWDCIRRGTLAQRAWCWCRRSARPKGSSGTYRPSPTSLCPLSGDVSPRHFLNRARERKVGRTVTPAVDLPEAICVATSATLSGGNQQKAVLARALVTGAQCLLLFDPTRGVDVGAKQSIYAHDGAISCTAAASILFYSTELDEFVHLCDRVLVVYRSRIAGELRGSELTPGRHPIACLRRRPTPGRIDVVRFNGGALMRGGVGWIRALAASPVLPAFVLLVLMYRRLCEPRSFGADRFRLRQPRQQRHRAGGGGLGPDPGGAIGRVRPLWLGGRGDRQCGGGDDQHRRSRQPGQPCGSARDRAGCRLHQRLPCHTVWPAVAGGDDRLANRLPGDRADDPRGAGRRSRGCDRLWGHGGYRRFSESRRWWR